MSSWNNWFVVLHVALPIKQSWFWIWKLKIPPKIQLFVWKYAHHRIPTKSVIFPYATLSDQVCPRCNEIEVPIHVLQDCHFARHISRYTWKLPIILWLNYGVSERRWLEHGPRVITEFVFKQILFLLKNG